MCVLFDLFLPVHDLLTTHAFPLAFLRWRNLMARFFVERNFATKCNDSLFLIVLLVSVVRSFLVGGDLLELNSRVLVVFRLVA